MTGIVDPSGKPARQADDICPGCNKPCPRGDVRARQLSGGFGQVHDVCRRCGHDFDELTIDFAGNAV